MHDRELYATILGVTAPWTVERVEVDLASHAVHVWLQREAGAAVECPECRTAQTIYDHREREWRHLDTCQLATRLHARVPRVDCPTHGVLQIRVPWAAPSSQFTMLFERLVIDWLQSAATSAVARRVGISWDETWGIMRRAVARGLARRGELQAGAPRSRSSTRPSPARSRGCFRYSTTSQLTPRSRRISNAPRDLPHTGLW